MKLVFEEETIDFFGRLKTMLALPRLCKLPVLRSEYSRLFNWTLVSFGDASDKTIVVALSLINIAFSEVAQTHFIVRIYFNEVRVGNPRKL